MKHSKRPALAATLASALALLAACGSQQDPSGRGAPRAMTLTILHINDHHSHLDSRRRTLALNNAAGDATAVSVSAGGFARVKGAIDALAAQSPNVLKLHAGDALTGTLYFNHAGQPGQADAALMNTVCFDAMALGNHEFDKGDAGLKTFIDALHEGRCKTPVLSANVRFGPHSPLSADAAPGKVRPDTIVQRGDQPIGIIGLTIAGKTRQASRPDPGTDFMDETATAQARIDALRARGVNKIILLSHIGYPHDKQLIARLSGVDVVVGGDSHSLLGPASLATYEVGSPEGSYPTEARDKDGKRVCLVQAWEYSQVVGELNVDFDAKGDVIRCAGRPHVLIDQDFRVGDALPAAPDQAAFLAGAKASGMLRIQAPDPVATAALQPFKAKADIYSRSVVATVARELCRRRVPGRRGDVSNSSAACNAEGSVHQRGGDIQQLVAQAYLDVANAHYGGADISLQSGGGVRIALPEGAVTAARVIEVLPFGNRLWRLDLSGAEVKACWKTAWRRSSARAARPAPTPMRAACAGTWTRPGHGAIASATSRSTTAPAPAGARSMPGAATNSLS